MANPMADAGVLARPTVQTVWARVRGLLLAPAEEWKIIDGERPTPRELLMRWALPATLFFFLAQMIGSMAFPPRVGGVSSAPSAVQSIATVVVGTVFMLGGVGMMAWLVDWLAPKFGGKRNFEQALKLTVYSGTAFWASGVFGLVPAIAFLGVTCIVSFYTLWRGLPVLMRNDADKTLPYAACVIAAAAVIGVTLMALSGCFALAGRGSAIAATAPTPAAPIVAPAPKPADPSAGIDREKFRRLLPEAIPGGWVRAGVLAHNGGSKGFTGPTLDGVYERGHQTLTVRFIDLGKDGAAKMIADQQALAPPTEYGRKTIAYSADPYGFRLDETDRDAVTVRRLVVVRDRVGFSVEGTGGVTADELTAAAALVDMERVEQIARGL